MSSIETLTPMLPVRIRAAMRRPCSSSPLQTLPERPYTESLAMAIASASSA